ncbi:hypothetical protein [Halovulum marinum]|uniref:hypothetical protein n=1 Tax=Halovulum marinum TaxID=2662447 RepID=UPI001F229FA2|nr:hypothetical protein [Halovulum marinum]
MPNTLPGAAPSAGVVAVRAAGGVVVADVKHVVVALEHARKTPEPDIRGAAVAALGHHAHIRLAEHPQPRFGDAL